MREKIEEAIKEILRQLRVAGGTEGNKNIPLLGRGGVVDSLTAMRLITAIERRFNVDIMGDLNLDCMESTDSLTEYLLQQVHEIEIGRHLIIDCDHCPLPLLDDPDAIRAIIRAVSDAVGTCVLKEEYHRFSPAGITGFAIVSASHIAVHTWPEHAYMGIDIFSCRDIRENAVLDALKPFCGDAGFRCRFLERKAMR